MTVFNLNNIQPQTAQNQPKPLLLLVDDEIENIKTLGYLLADDYEVLSAANGVEAIEILQAMDDPKAVKLVISDQTMPNMSGTELLRKIKLMLPDTILLLVSGANNIDQVADTNDIFQMITKPIDPEAFLQAIEQGFASHHARHKLMLQVSELEMEIQVISEQLTEKKRALIQIRENLASH